MSAFSAATTKGVFLTVVVLFPSFVAAQTYSGPKRLGTFSLDGKLISDALSKQLGPSKYNRWQ
jgi:hypothetical protein